MGRKVSGKRRRQEGDKRSGNQIQQVGVDFRSGKGENERGKKQNQERNDRFEENS